MTHIDLLGTPETRRSGLSTRKALKALTSTLIYCWNIIVNNLNEKKTEYIDFEQGSKRRRPLINYFLIIDYLYSRKFPVPKCFFAEKTFANSNSNLKKNAKITKNANKRVAKIWFFRDSGVLSENWRFWYHKFSQLYASNEACYLEFYII